MATGPVKNFIEFSDAELAVFGGHHGFVQNVEAFMREGRYNPHARAMVVVPMAASAKHDCTEFLSRARMQSGCLASDFTGCWQLVNDKQPAWLLVTAKAGGAPFAELRVNFAQKVKLSDFLSGERTKGMFTMTGDMWASICRGASETATAADLVASIRAEYDVDDETPLVALGLTCRPGGAPFNRVTQDDVDEESELEGHVDSE